MPEEDTNADRPTVPMDRDALLGLIDQTAAPPAPLAHTVSREALRARAVTRNESVIGEVGLLERTGDAVGEPLDTDISPSLSPFLVAAVIVLLVVAFIAATHVQ